MKRWVLLLPLLAVLAACSGESVPPGPTPTETDTPTVTSTPTSTPTVTPTLGIGANITYFGLLRADNSILPPVQVDQQQRLVFERPVGSGFVIVVEATAGVSGARPGASTFNYDAGDPTRLPDLQIESSQPLGDGSAAVCDVDVKNYGGVPALDPDYTELTPDVSAALNDFGCRFVDGSGATTGRVQAESCVLFPDADFHFIAPSTQIQYCATVVRKLRLPEGDTIFTARVRDILGVVGPPRQIVVRVQEASDPTPTPVPGSELGLCYEQVGCMALPFATTMSQGNCCNLALSSTGLPFSWCPHDAVDPLTNDCSACLGHPCLGLPTPGPGS